MLAEVSTVQSQVTLMPIVIVLIITEELSIQYIFYYAFTFERMYTFW